MPKKDKKTSPGPKPDRVKINQSWEDAMSGAMKKKRPKGGWPKDDQGKTKEEKE